MTDCYTQIKMTISLTRISVEEIANLMNAKIPVVKFGIINVGNHVIAVFSIHFFEL